MRPHQEATERAELDDAWASIVARRTRLGTDRRLAELTLEVVRARGNGPEHLEILRDVAKAWTADWALALAASELLIEQAGRRGMDEPPIRADTAATWAASALDDALGALSPSERGEPDVAGRLHASLANALRLCGPGRDEAARDAWNRALELDESRGSWWYDSGILHKWRGRFDDGLAASETALDRGAPRRPTLWNLAICATALGRGDVAVRAWNEIGIPASADPKSGMPFVDGLPPLLLRVLSRPSPVDGTTELAEGVGFELVWVAPLSPCHGVVQSPTFRDAPIDYGDLVLWDGAPVAEHGLTPGERVPVFPLLEILKRGDERRWPFVSLERESGALEALRKTLPEGVRLFVQEERLEPHCGDCEAGVPHEHDASGDAEASGSSRGVLRRGKVIVAAGADLEALQARWEQGLGAQKLVAALPGLYEALQQTKRAGQEHQAWRGIERTALKRKERS